MNQIYNISPFIVGGSVVGSHIPIERFINREKGIQTTISQLFGPGRGSIAISGERRIGKTSLLHYLNTGKVFENEKYTRAFERLGINLEKVLMTFVDCEGIDSFTEFWQLVFTRFKIDPKSDSFPQTIKSEMKRLLSKKQISYTDILPFLHKCRQQEYYVILLVDEFDWLIREENYESLQKTRKFLYALRNLMNQDILRGYFSMVIATRLPLDYSLKNVEKELGSPFHNIFLSLTLEPFKNEDIAELFSIYVKELDIQESEKISKKIDLCYRLSGGYPYLFQMAGNILFNITVLDGWETEIPNERIIEEFEQQARQQFQFLWDYSTDEQKEVMQFIALRALKGELATGEIIDTKDVKEIFARLVHHVEGLKQRGMCVGETSNPMLFSPLFTKFVVKELQAKDKSHWDERRMIFMGLVRESTAEEIGSKLANFWDTNYASLKRELSDWTNIIRDMLPLWPKISPL